MVAARRAVLSLLYLFESTKMQIKATYNIFGFLVYLLCLLHVYVIPPMLEYKSQSTNQKSDFLFHHWISLGQLPREGPGV